MYIPVGLTGYVRVLRELYDILEKSFSVISKMVIGSKGNPELLWKRDYIHLCTV